MFRMQTRIFSSSACCASFACSWKVASKLRVLLRIFRSDGVQVAHFCIGPVAQRSCSTIVADGKWHSFLFHFSVTRENFDFLLPKWNFCALSEQNYIFILRFSLSLNNSSNDNNRKWFLFNYKRVLQIFKTFRNNFDSFLGSSWKRVQFEF